jgi:hypothetical protein
MLQLAQEYGMNELKAKTLEKITPFNCVQALKVIHEKDIGDVEKKILHHVTAVNCAEMLRLAQEYSLQLLRQKVLEQISPNNCLDMLSLALELGLRDVEETISKCITAQNCTDVLKVSKEHNLAKLKEAALKYQCTFFDELVDTGTVVNLAEEDLMAILESDGIVRRREDQVFTALQKWVHGEESREKRFTQLLSLVKLENLTKKFTDEVVINEDLMDGPCMKLLWRATNLTESETKHATTSTGPDVATLKAKDVKDASTLTSFEYSWVHALQPVHTNSALKNRLIVGEGFGGILELAENRWKWFPGPSKMNARCHGCQCPGGFVITGGKHSSSTISTESSTRDAFFYSDADKRWKELPQMRQAHSWHQSICFKGEVYVFDYNSFEKFSFNQRRWRRMQSITFKCNGTYAAVANNCLFVVDGWEGTVHGFDESTNAWKKRSDMPSQCYHGACTARDDAIFVVGKESQNLTATTRCLRYDTGKDSWTVMSSPSKILSGNCDCLLVPNQEKIFLIGETYVEEYDPNTDKWKMAQIAKPKSTSLRFGFILPSLQ